MPTSCASFRATQISLFMAMAASLAACGGGSDATSADAAGVDTTTATLATIAKYQPPNRGPAAGALTVSWVAPTVSADGAPLSDLVGFRILIGTTSGSYTNSVTVTDPTALTYSFTGLATGTYYVVVKAFDTANNESLPSAEASKKVR